MRKRTWILISLILATVGYTRLLSDVRAVPLRTPLASIPSRIDGWQSRSMDLQEEIVRVVGVEDYLLREYRNTEGFSVSVYLGYYEQQREGDQIHSPKLCLPGGGWTPQLNDRVTLDTPGFNGGFTRANRYVIGKGDARQVVLYWYQSRGRNIVSEYLAKVWLVTDSIFRKRNDGCLVRFISPLPKGASVAEVQAQMTRFAQGFLPAVADALPE
jgi:EpsI family protein